MTDNPYGPDRPCQRSACTASNQFAEQDARDRAIAAGDDPADVLADPLPAVGDHLGGAHLDPRDREHYDGLDTSYGAAPYAVKNAAKPLLVAVGGFSRPSPDDHPMRPAVDVALHACLDEIDRLRQQVAHVQVDADRKVREASRRALDCDAHGDIIRQTEAQADNFARAAERHEKARIALLGEHQAIRDMLDAYDRGDLTATDPHPIMVALRSLNTKTSAAHKRAWNGRS